MNRGPLWQDRENNDGTMVPCYGSEDHCNGRVKQCGWTVKNYKRAVLRFGWRRGIEMVQWAL